MRSQVKFKEGESVNTWYKDNCWTDKTDDEKLFELCKNHRGLQARYEADLASTGGEHQRFWKRVLRERQRAKRHRAKCLEMLRFRRAEGFPMPSDSVPVNEPKPKQYDPVRDRRTYNPPQKARMRANKKANRARKAGGTRTPEATGASEGSSSGQAGLRPIPAPTQRFAQDSSQAEPVAPWRSQDEEDWTQQQWRSQPNRSGWGSDWKPGFR